MTRYAGYVTHNCHSVTAGHKQQWGRALEVIVLSEVKSEQRFKSKPTNLEAQCGSLVTTPRYGRIITRKRSGDWKVTDALGIGGGIGHGHR